MVKYAGTRSGVHGADSGGSIRSPRNNGRVTAHAHDEAALESRWEAAPAIGVVILLQALVAGFSAARGWDLAGIGWWIWLVPIVPECVLLLPLALSRRQVRVAQLGERRSIAIELLGITGIANAAVLVALIMSLLNGSATNGGELLTKAGTVWVTNMITFGLWFWILDGGGPSRRRVDAQGIRDMQFPQMENPALAAPGWHPRLVDYIYVSFTNAIAFSPTDVMPLSRTAKMLMMAESALSALTVLLVAARAVNIFR